LGGAVVVTAGLWAEVTDLDKPTSPNAAEALATASYLLWVLSGRKWSGVHEVTEEYICDGGIPCCGGWVPDAGDYRAGYAYFASRFRDPNWGRREDQKFLFLRGRPVREIKAVRRLPSGAEVDLKTLAVYDHAYLAPAGDGVCDPCFDPCGLEVTYTYGSKPPPAGVTAVLDLANEFVKSIECPDECRLPERVTSVSRQGVNYSIFDPQDFLTDGRIGLYSVDVFLKAINPNKAQLPARVFSPDLPVGRRKTWPVAAPARRRRR
jgi:hypothetical protein